jgi:hypothetical protein
MLRLRTVRFGARTDRDRIGRVAGNVVRIAEQALARRRESIRRQMTAIQ